MHMYGLLIIFAGFSLLVGGVLLAIARRRAMEPGPDQEVPETIDLTPRDPWARATPVAVHTVARSGKYQVSRNVLPGR
jgi:hypothetical protein